ncbi:MAG: filamentous hemagglutinin N-terminal domain-containing protein [Rhodobacteraceae bacterium]|nr:filamentous hemagglutinin N-terminal domain-containing protein [Paracoccaceae bacterium]
MPPKKRRNHSGLSACVICCLFLTTDLCAEIATDGSLGQPAQTLIGPDFSIPEALGSRADNNLFHSFQRFNIHTGESATFTGADTITNVISRVTGGELSTIDGRLTSEIGTADFYFINPAGVMFGANAQVSVPGSFYVSTANELRFTDGSAYSATHPESSTLSIEEPASFGFLGDQTGSISMVGSNLLFEPASTVALSGNELKIDQTELAIDQGDIQLVATGDAATDVTVAGDLSVPAAGKLTITDSTIDASGEGAGRIVIQGGASQIESSKIFADNTGPVDASADKGIDIRSRSLNIGNSFITTDTNEQGRQAANLSVDVTEDLLVVNGGEVRSRTIGAGDSGEVRVTAGTLTVDDQGSNFFTGIQSIASRRSSGNTGNVTLIVDDAVSILNGSVVGSSTLGAGDAGQVRVTAGTLTVENQTRVFTGIVSIAGRRSSGKAGNVTVTIDDNVSLLNGVSIGSATFASRDAGEVQVTADTLTIDGQGGELFTGIESRADDPGSSGNAGIVTVTIDDAVSILNGGTIGSATFGAGDTGEVLVSAGTLTIDGQDHDFFTGILSQAQPGSSGNAGSVTVTIDDAVSIVNGGAVSSSTFGAGDGGQASVTAGTLTVDRQDSQLVTGIASFATSDSLGQAGNITLDIQNLWIVNGGTISIESEPTVDKTILANIQPAEINISAQNLTLSNAAITTESFGNVPAGSITLNVADTLSLDPSRITTAANNADGGPISINARVIDLQESQITTSVAGQGDGGDIAINSKVLILDSGFIQANTQAGAAGGDIRINADALIASHDQLFIGGERIDFQTGGINVIQAAAPTGVSGRIDISTPQLDISGNLTGLGASLLDVAEIAHDPCATPGGRQSTLSSVGKGGLAETPAQVGSVAVDSERLKRLLQPAKDSSSMPPATDAPDSFEPSEAITQPLPLLVRRSLTCG